jgi:hypothetical protein
MILLIQDEAQKAKELARKAARETEPGQALALLAEGQIRFADIICRLAGALWALARDVGRQRGVEADGKPTRPRPDSLARLAPSAARSPALPKEAPALSLGDLAVP